MTPNPVQKGRGRFRAHNHLKTQEEFRNLFKSGRRWTDSCLSVRWKLDSSRPPFQLGFALSKRVIKHAVDRKLIKRLSIEHFRILGGQLQGVQAVVSIRRGFRYTRTPQTRSQLHGSLKALLRRLLQPCADLCRSTDAS